MIDTKAMIIHQILKLDKPFKGRYIYDELGISPQNVSNHLRRMVDKGILTKQSTIYTVINKEALIDELISVSEGTNLEKFEEVIPFITQTTATNYQEAVDQVVRARVLEKAEVTDVHVVMNQRIDETIEQYKRLKKWLNSKTYTLSRAEKGFDETMWNAVKEMMIGE